MKKSTQLMLALFSSLVTSAAFAVQGFNMSTAHIMDANKDGKITKEEYMKHSQDMEAWTKMDTNKDGVLDENEIKAGFNDK